MVPASPSAVKALEQSSWTSYYLAGVYPARRRGGAGEAPPSFGKKEFFYATDAVAPSSVESARQRDGLRAQRWPGRRGGTPGPGWEYPYRQGNVVHLGVSHGRP